MKIDIATFIGLCLSVWIIIAFFLDYINGRYFSKLKKEIRLERRTCEVCCSVYFVSLFFEFWHCPLCGSINKEHTKVV
ncbi:MAG: hypothetical protein JW867_09160 [Candidatus Omnitrophica bacterium]|nr:hypothetical protein [Candidatus Omnitrophota bacterium]